MAWISPVSRATGFLVTAARWNQDVVDNGVDLNDRVTSLEAGGGPITTAKLADSAVTSAKLGSSAVTSAKLANGAVTGDKLAASLLSYDAIGSYMLARQVSAGATNAPGSTRAGSSLNPSASSGLSSSAHVSGTWRCMGYSTDGGGDFSPWDDGVTLWVRIS
ncbi:MAG: hypothetical protein OXG79_09135 [Chloroflexi bacterium]|nr:hypothetical protein [Chloroflexota bacterium]MCY4112052.1 hypothetical protein [Chloroflexota bacterium]